MKAMRNLPQTHFKTYISASSPVLTLFSPCTYILYELLLYVDDGLLILFVRRAVLSALRSFTLRLNQVSEADECERIV